MAVTYVNIEQQRGIREDLIDKIVNISPKDRPVMANTGHVQAKGTTHSWTNEALATADATNAVLAGATVTFAAADWSARTQSSNYTQIPRRKVSADYTTDAVNKVQLGMGEKSEFNHQKTLKFEELLNDCEAIIVSNNTGVPPLPNTGTVGVSAGLQKMITTNAFDASNSPYNGVVTQQLIDDMSQAAWSQGGMPDKIFCGARAKRAIASFVTQVNRPVSDSGKKLTNVVNSYETTTGDLDIFLERNLITALLMLDTRYVNHAWLREPKFTETGITGSFTGGFYEAELTVELLAEKSCAKATGLAYS